MTIAPERAFAIIAAGGTGGHIYPGIAVADALVALGHERTTIRFVTESRPMSTRAIGNAGYDYDLVALGHGLQRRLTIANLVVVFKAWQSFVQSWRLLSRYQPQVVLGFGAYVTLPIIAAARLRRIPVVVHEQNAFPGLANRLAVHWGSHAAVSVPATPLAGATFTGNPVRPEVVAVRRRPESPPLVAFVGGSLGAAILDTTALGLFERWRDRDDIAIHHVSGNRSFLQCRSVLDETRRAGDQLEYKLVEYEHDMPALYSRASLMITRAGGSVAELAATGMPAIVVPWPGATERHQHANAQAMADHGAAVMVDEKDCTVERIAALCDGLLLDREALEAMSAAGRELANPNAAVAVANLAETVSRPR